MAHSLAKSTGIKASQQSDGSPPNESYTKLFLRFLRFGCLAWGGPVAQIAMIREELVEEERWISREKFNRVLAVYQVLPGPEAHELCVYFGMIARGRFGAILAGLGFMLPGFILMFALSWFYVSYGIHSPVFAAIFYGFQAAAIALIVRAIHRIGGHVLQDFSLWIMAIFGAVAHLAGVHFLLILVCAGSVNLLLKHSRIGYGPACVLFPLFAVPLIAQASPQAPNNLELFVYGLRSGLLTFGGAYTAIPFLQHDAVINGGWITNEQFLDGLALSSILPAPLIIFSTFVGYLGGGPIGATVLTVGIFLPAFSFTLIGHNYFERLIENNRIHAFLDGVAAGVVGLIAATTLGLFAAAITDLPAFAIFAAGLFALYRSKSKATIAAVMLSSGLLGWMIKSL